MPAPTSTRRGFVTVAAGAAVAAGCARRERPVAVLTFDDAVKSHRSFVAPILAQRGFNATFFVTHRWMEDKDNFLDWDEIAELHNMGFEIGNHSWTHIGLSTPRTAALLEPEIALVQNALAKVGVPNPTSFAWCGNAFGPEAFRELQRLGFRYARRGMQPEQPYGKIAVGPAYQPERHHPLLIPTTGEAYPDWTLEHFRRVLDRASAGLVVLQFHGVPDVAHTWVHTPPERFEEYMQELTVRDFEVIAIRDLEGFLAPAPPVDPLSQERYPKTNEPLRAPVEVEQTRAALPRWTITMRRHAYTRQEAQQTAWLTPQEASAYEKLEAPPSEYDGIEIAPYPGGARSPRIGFLDGAIAPLRGSKLSVFLPWDKSAYVVIDLPELITSTVGHQYLAHTHVPTIWNDRNVWIENVDSEPMPNGALALEWTLPNGVVFGSKATPGPHDVALELWLRNGTPDKLEGLRTQVCAMLKGAPGFTAQTQDNKTFLAPVAAARSDDGHRWILIAWERTGRSWGNPQCPCFHADPVFEDCSPGETVRLRGRLWFHEGDSIDAELAEARKRFSVMPGTRVG
ncbi:MAG: polysaccharide deacetylase family protein [Bryobacterales bacterium]|nr:polysaccharide deacetylase family protein [Bryobacterales bacterium]